MVFPQTQGVLESSLEGAILENPQKIFDYCSEEHSLVLQYVILKNKYLCNYNMIMIL